MMDYYSLLNFFTTLIISIIILNPQQASYADDNVTVHIDKEQSIEEIGLRKRICHANENSSVQSTALVFEWSELSPDNFAQQGITVNGSFPGPTITTFPNTTLIINVVNKLGRGFVLHFHGIHQVGSLDSDGVPGVTQAEIPSNESYVYEFYTGTQAGTFMYHAHTKFDLVWAFGGLIIQDAANHTFGPYQEEKLMYLSQCFHQHVDDIFNGLFESPFPDVPDPASLLINGKSWGVWNQTSNNNNNVAEGYEVITVNPNDVIRFRVIGMAVDSMMNFYIQNHTFTVIEADGILIDPVVTDHLEVNTAQRYSILVSLNQSIGNYEIRTEMIPDGGPRNGYAILHYAGAPDPTPIRNIERPGVTPNVELSTWILPQIHPHSQLSQFQVYPIPLTYDREIIIESTEIKYDEQGGIRFLINGELFTEDKVPLLHQLHNLTSTELIQSNFTNQEPKIYEIFIGQSIQVVLQNTHGDDGECEQHPWHFHGHSFYVVGQGPDGYDHDRDAPMINSNVRSGKLELRDVTTVFANTTTSTSSNQTQNSNDNKNAHCGWQAVRFSVNNPGLWLIHCHLTAHMDLGKKFIFYEHSKADPLLKFECDNAKNLSVKWSSSVLSWSFYIIMYFILSMI